MKPSDFDDCGGSIPEMMSYENLINLLEIADDYLGVDTCCMVDDDHDKVRELIRRIRRVISNYECKKEELEAMNRDK